MVILRPAPVKNRSRGSGLAPLASGPEPLDAAGRGRPIDELLDRREPWLVAG